MNKRTIWSTKLEMSIWNGELCSINLDEQSSLKGFHSPSSFMVLLQTNEK